MNIYRFLTQRSSALMLQDGPQRVDVDPALELAVAVAGREHYRFPARFRPMLQQAHGVDTASEVPVRWARSSRIAWATSLESAR
jgi:hypothetical protein